MKKNLSISFVILFLLTLNISSNVIAKKAAIVIDYDTKEVLFEINADTKNYLPIEPNKGTDKD